MAIGALAVDAGMLYAVRAEAQRIADASALAGASAFLGTPLSTSVAVDSAKHWAKELAGRNTIFRTPVDTSLVSETGLTETSNEVYVEVDPTDRIVRVRVRRPGIGLWFARILGVQTVDVGAWAAAQAADAGRANCMKPFTIPDQGYQLPRDLGRLDTIKAADPTSSGVDPFYFPWEMPIDDPNMNQYCPNLNNPHSDPFNYGDDFPSVPVTGGNCDNSGDPAKCWYQANICNQNCAEVSLGTTYNVITGNVTGKSSFGVNTLIEQDPDIEWDGSRLVRNGMPVDDLNSPRVIKIPLYDPAVYHSPNQRTIEFSGIALFFLEDGPGSPTADPGVPWGPDDMYDTEDLTMQMVGRFLAYAPGSGGGEITTPFSRYLRLIE
jgi:hypothetical protein